MEQLDRQAAATAQNDLDKSIVEGKTDGVEEITSKLDKTVIDPSVAARVRALFRLR